MKWLGRLRASLRLWPSRIGRRVLAFNLLLVFLPAFGVLYLDVYEQQLLEAQERSMVQQARLVAAALGGSDADRTADAIELFRRLERRSESRVRVYDVTGALVADSSRVLTEIVTSERESYPPGTTDSIRARLLYRVGVVLVQVRSLLWKAVETMLTSPPRSSNADDEGNGPTPEVTAALAGRYGAATRPTPGQRSLTLHSAVPIRTTEGVVGVVRVSQSTRRILLSLYAVRLRTFQIVIVSFAAAAVLGLIFSRTIVLPLVRLKRATAVLGHRPHQVPARFPGADAPDEIGDLARALEELTKRLVAHVQLLETFAADLSHEFKNPLASIRTAAETLATSPGEEERQRFIALLTRDVDRLERLVTGVRELARIDAQLATEDLAPVDVGRLVSEVVEGLKISTGHRFELSVSSDRPMVVRASPDRLVQVFENVMVNACGFSPADEPVVVAVDSAGGSCRISVADRGPGIPPEHVAKVFDRFFTYRPNDRKGRRDHAGLGLAIARAIVEGYGGSISVANDPGGGARFEVRLPIAAD